MFGSIFIDNKDAEQSLSKTEEKTEGLGAKLLKGAGTAAKWGAAIGGAAIAGGAALMGMAKNAAANTDRIDKMSQKIGISRKGFQEWDFILSQSGTSIEKMQVGMKTMVQRMDEAASGTGKGAEAFDTLNISVTDLEGNLRSQEDVFEETVKKLQEMPEGAEKSQLAFELFGKAGLELMPLLNSTGGTVDELKQKAEELGIVLSDEAVDAGVVFTDTMDQLERSFGAVVTQVGVHVMPIIQQLLDWVIANMPTIQAVMETVFGAIQTFVQAAADVFTTYLLPAFQAVVSWVQENWPRIREVIGDVMGKVSEVIQSVVATVQDIWAKWGEQVMEVVTTAWEYIKDFVEASIKIVQGIIQTVTSLIKGDWEGAWEGIKGILSGVWDKITLVVEVGLDLIQTLIDTVFGAISKVASEIWEGIETKIASVVEGIQKTVGDVFDSLKNTVTTIWDGIQKAIEDPIGAARDFVSRAIERMKGFFDFTWELPKIKLPHFSISGKFSLNPPQIPKFNISWYKDGGIFTQPTLFNTPFGMKGVGEAGPEAVLPIEKLPDLLGFDKFDHMIELLKILVKKESNIYLDGDTLVGELIDDVDKRLADKQVRSSLAYGGAL